ARRRRARREERGRRVRVSSARRVEGGLDVLLELLRVELAHDVLPDETSIAADEPRLREAGDPEAPQARTVPVVDDRVAEPVALDEAAGVRLEVLRVDPDDNEPLVPV